MKDVVSYLRDLYARIWDGTTTAKVSTDGGLSVQDRLLAVAQGAVTGSSLMLKFGRNPDVDAAAAETIWEGGGSYPFDATAQSLEIISDDVNDDGDPASTGALTVTVYGVDASYAAKSETVTLNGTTAVALTGTWLRVNRAQVATAGSSGANEGTLTIRIAGAGATKAVISPLNGQTLMAVWTVPAGYSAYMLNYYVSINTATPATAAAIDVKLLTRSNLGVINLEHQQSTLAGALQHMFGAPFKIAEKTDIYLDVSTSANNSDVCGGFDLVVSAN